VAPGTTLSEMVGDASWVKIVERWTAARRVGRPDDIADIVAFLASDDARWLTGQTLQANGGQVTTAATIMVYGRPAEA
jgi:3-oxoacyl-[acyl-carrier protein] reductase